MAKVGAWIFVTLANQKTKTLQLHLTCLDATHICKENLYVIDCPVVVNLQSIGLNVFLVFL